MTQHIPAIDITDPQALVRAAEDVERTQTPRLIKRGDKEIAMLSPLEPKEHGKTRARRKTKPIPKTDPIFNIIGIGAGDGAPVSENVDKYLADAIYEQSFRPKEQ